VPKSRVSTKYAVRSSRCSFRGFKALRYSVRTGTFPLNPAGRITTLAEIIQPDSKQQRSLCVSTFSVTTVMDNFPYPNHLNIPPVEVPHLTGFEFDQLDFSTFPDRLGFTRDGVLDVGRPCEQLAAMAQSWLYFGLIDIFTGQRHDKTAFIRQEGSTGSIRSVIDSKALDDMLEVSKIRLRKNRKRSKILSNIRAKLLVAAKASSELDMAQGYDLSSASVLLSIKVLILYLSDYFDAAYWRDVGTKIPRLSLQKNFRVLKPGQENERPMAARLLMERMYQAGWCIHQTLELCRSQDYCTVYYLSSIRRQELRDITHKSCSETKCSAYNTNDTTYRIKHTDEQCQCKLIEVPSQQVASIVKDGGIPLIGLRPESSQNVQLEVARCTPHTKYTAISHIWIDGLGNPTANALPNCQLRKLATELSDLVESQRYWYSRALKYFVEPSKVPHMWMDTLCIPVRPEHADLRMKAINRMALIYTGAKQVLVLDTELRQLDRKPKPRELIDAKILCSKWNERCWTLQEGALARKCLFQFRDSAIAASHYEESVLQLFRRGLKSPITSLKLAWRLFIDDLSMKRVDYDFPPPRVSSDFGQEYIRKKLSMAAVQSAMADLDIVSNARDRQKPGEDLRLVKFVRSWNEVGRRSTTKDADIHVILANLTDFSAAQIMSLGTQQERTLMMLQCIGRFPLDMLYNDYSRPEAGGNHADRWVPSVPASQPLSARVLLRYVKEGLILEAERPDALPDIFYIDSAAMPSRFCFRVENKAADLWYWVNCIQPADDKLPRQAYAASCLVITRMSDPVDTSALRSTRAARLLVSGGMTNKSKRIYARFDCPIVYVVKSFPPSDRELTSVPILVATKLPSDQKLVIEQSKCSTSPSHANIGPSFEAGYHR